MMELDGKSSSMTMNINKLKMNDMTQVFKIEKLKFIIWIIEWNAKNHQVVEHEWFNQKNQTGSSIEFHQIKIHFQFMWWCLMVTMMMKLKYWWWNVKMEFEKSMGHFWFLFHESFALSQEKSKLVLIKPNWMTFEFKQCDPVWECHLKGFETRHQVSQFETQFEYSKDENIENLTHLFHHRFQSSHQITSLYHWWMCKRISIDLLSWSPKWFNQLITPQINKQIDFSLHLNINSWIIAVTTLINSLPINQPFYNVIWVDGWFCDWMVEWCKSVWWISFWLEMSNIHHHHSDIFSWLVVLSYHLSCHHSLWYVLCSESYWNRDVIKVMQLFYGVCEWNNKNLSTKFSHLKIYFEEQWNFWWSWEIHWKCRMMFCFWIDWIQSEEHSWDQQCFQYREFLCDDSEPEIWFQNVSQREIYHGVQWKSWVWLHLKCWILEILQTRKQAIQNFGNGFHNQTKTSLHQIFVDNYFDSKFQNNVWCNWWQNVNHVKEWVTNNWCEKWWILIVNQTDKYTNPNTNLLLWVEIGRCLDWSNSIDLEILFEVNHHNNLILLDLFSVSPKTSLCLKLFLMWKLHMKSWLSILFILSLNFILKFSSSSSSSSLWFEILSLKKFNLFFKFSLSTQISHISIFRGWSVWSFLGEVSRSLNMKDIFEETSLEI